MRNFWCAACFLSFGSDYAAEQCPRCGQAELIETLGPVNYANATLFCGEGITLDGHVETESYA